MDPARRIQVFIVTLFAEPGAELRGRLRPVQNDAAVLFTGGAELLRLLRLAVEAPPPPDAHASGLAAPDGSGDARAAA